MIQQVIGLVKALQSNTDPRQIALGAVLGLFFGLTPSGQTHLIFLVLLFFFLKINRAAAMVVFAPAKLLYYLWLWPVADQIGYRLLTHPALPDGFWNFVTQAPVLALWRFDHTLVLGGVLLAAAASVPVFIMTLWAVYAYRASVAEKVGRWNVLRGLQSFSLFKWFFDRWGK